MKNSTSENANLSATSFVHSNNRVSWRVNRKTETGTVVTLASWPASLSHNVITWFNEYLLDKKVIDIIQTGEKGENNKDRKKKQKSSMQNEKELTLAFRGELTPTGYQRKMILTMGKVLLFRKSGLTFFPIA